MSSVSLLTHYSTVPVLRKHVNITIYTQLYYSANGILLRASTVWMSALLQLSSHREHLDCVFCPLRLFGLNTLRSTGAAVWLLLRRCFTICMQAALLTLTCC